MEIRSMTRVTQFTKTTKSKGDLRSNKIRKFVMPNTTSNMSIVHLLLINLKSHNAQMYVPNQTLSFKN